MIEVHVCVGSCCHLNGAYNVLQTFQQMVEEKGLHDRFEIKMSFCMRRCGEAVSVKAGDQYYSVRPEAAREFFQNTLLSVNQ